MTTPVGAARMGRFGDPASMVQASPHMTPEQQLANVLNGFASKLDRIVREVGRLADREIPAPQVTVAAPPAPKVVVDLDGVRDALTDAIRSLPQGGLDAGEIAAAFAQVLQQHKFEIDPAALKALVESRGKATVVSGPSLRLVQLEDASHNTVNPATKDEQSAQTALLAEIKRGLTDYDQRFDYDGADTQPSRVGYAPAGTATSAAAWTIYSYTYDSSDRVTAIAVTTGQVWA